MNTLTNAIAASTIVWVMTAPASAQTVHPQVDSDLGFYQGIDFHPKSCFSCHWQHEEIAKWKVNAIIEWYTDRWITVTQALIDEASHYVRSWMAIRQALGQLCFQDAFHPNDINAHIPWPVWTNSWRAADSMFASSYDEVWNPVSNLAHILAMENENRASLAWVQEFDYEVHYTLWMLAWKVWRLIISWDWRLVCEIK